ncbi:MAG: ribosome hibernation-promoting factor, HPF/YfiA family [Iamia sp.]
MEVTVSARHTEVPERLRLQAEEKVGRLDRFVDGMDRAEVHFSTHRNPRIAEPEMCEVTIEGHGHHVRAKVAAADGYVAVDKAVAKIEHQLSKLKTKLQRQRRGSSRTRGLPVDEGLVPDDLAASVTAPPEAPDGQGPARIVKVKRFATMGMTADEAAQRMDLLGHGFFFFTNLDTGRAAVVYRREDGDIGLIDEDG